MTQQPSADNQRSMESDDPPVRWFDPLPQRYLTDHTGVGGRIKLRAEDFLVEELPLYEPCGEGEHLYLFIEKHGVSHSELVSKVQRRFGVRRAAIGFAGMKDKIGATRQLVSVHLPGIDVDFGEPIQLDHDRIAVHWAARHTNKLRRGHLRGNRFSIRMREVDPLHVMRARSIIESLKTTGVPNYFGEQRFGYRRNNHLLGALLLLGRWDDALSELVGTGFTPAPAFQRSRRELYDRGCVEQALSMWATSDRAERMVLRSLRAGHDARSSCMSLDKTSQNFFISAFQSAVFNRLLDQRIAAGAVGRIDPGEIAWNHASRRTFELADAQEDAIDAAARLDRMEISPSGPMWGVGLVAAGGAAGQSEVAALQATGVTHEQFKSSQLVPTGARRPYRVPLEHVELEGGVDEHGGFIRIAFDLPRGAYATVVLREIMKTPVDPVH